jgi:ornithine decarboxylase
VFQTYAPRDPALQRGFMVYDLGEVSRLYDLWERELPGVRPYFAVKCQPDEHLIAHLYELGARFDCASPAEMDLVRRHTDCPPQHLLYANPMKSPADLQEASRRGIKTTVVDSVDEIKKIAEIAPKMKALIRIYANDPDAKCPLSHKYGSFPNEWEALLECARTNRVSLTGISFHVGSGAKSPAAFKEALRQATALNRLASSYGFSLDLLDLGGGFTVENFQAVSKTLRTLLPTTPFKWTIAEPGRFFTETAGTLMTPIHGRRVRGNHRDYYISDSIYGSFNAILYDHLKPTPIPFGKDKNINNENAKTHPSTIYGATCDGLDTILKDIELPDLTSADWIMWPNMGAYTLPAASLFNGFPFPFIPKFYV